MPQKISPEFIQECIKHHNDYRTTHGAPPLVEDKKLNQLAQEWAESLAKREAMEHRGNNPYGENIYQGYNSDPKWMMKPIDPVKAWYDEISLYKFGEAKPRNPSAVGHFTQLVWKETEKVGVGMATSGKGYVYIVCNYDPPGNVIGQFAKNVLPAKKSSKKCKMADSALSAKAMSKIPNIDEQNAVTGEQSGLHGYQKILLTDSGAI